MRTPAPRIAALLAAGIVGATVAGITASGPAVASPPAPSLSANAKEVDNSVAITKGTWVKVRNEGDTTMYVRMYHSTGWASPVAINPGQERSFAYSRTGADDVELRFFFQESSAASNSDGIEVDADNPALTHPWLSVDWSREYFVVGRTHTWVADDGSRYWGKREGDCGGFKHFSLHVTNP